MVSRPRLRRRLLGLALAPALVESLRVGGVAGINGRFDEALPAEISRQVLDLAPVRYRIASRVGSAPVTVWDLQGQTTGPAEVAGMRLFPLGDRALTWTKKGAAAIWDTRTGGVLMELRGAGAVDCGHIFPKGDRVVTCSRGSLATVWDASSGAPLLSLRLGAAAISGEALYRDVVVLMGGDRLLTWGLRSTVWDVASGRAACALRRPERAIVTATARGVRILTVTSRDREALLWDAWTCTALHVLLESELLIGASFLEGGLFRRSAALDKHVGAHRLRHGVPRWGCLGHLRRPQGAHLGRGVGGSAARPRGSRGGFPERLGLVLRRDRPGDRVGPTWYRARNALATPSRRDSDQFRLSRCGREEWCTPNSDDHLGRPM